MGFKRIEDRPTPKEVYNFRVYFTAIQIAWGALTFGYDGAFIGTTLTRASFQRDFGLVNMSVTDRNNVSSNITALFSAGAFFGAAFGWPIMERYGRRICIQASVFVFIIGGILCTVATDQIAMIYAGRVFTGLGCGGITCATPTYLAEIAPPPVRGQMTGFFEIAYQCASVIGFWINYGIGQNMDSNLSEAWRIPMAVQLIPAGMLGIMSIFFVETPQFLFKRGRDEQAIKNLVWLRDLPVEHRYVQEDIALIQLQIENERSIAIGRTDSLWGYLRGSFHELSLPGMRNRVFLAFMMFMWQNFSGAAAINYYSPTLFGAIGITQTSLYTGIYGLIKAVGSIIFYLYFIDRWGRRQPWITSSVLCCICMVYLAVYVKIGHPAGETNLSASTVAGGKAGTAMIMLYSFFWSFGANGLPWIVAAEIYPLNVRSICAAYYAMLQWLFGFVLTKALPSMFTSMGWGVFLFFGCMLFGSAVWSILFLPETKGLSMPEMDVLFGFVGADSDYKHRIDDINAGRTGKMEVAGSDSVVSHHEKLSEDV
ncbi:putative hexose transport-related protein [Calocera viscosa TUFC12733]|uniref:Putative hexose transport-related protein n=1 Tax=Calocera viscosa (strain TUFC12733) TaxID=1330018 RepID=A0A167M3I6_CALVF|nr:putative hexose transport-related protein [Calocera viscosa TUFC12733]